MDGMRSGEAVILAPTGLVLASMPRSLSVGGASFELAARGDPRRLTFGVTATRIEGRWQRRWRSGRWWIDVLPTGRSRTLVELTVQGTAGVDMAQLVRRLRASVTEERRPATSSRTAEHVLPIPPVWETASP